MFWTLIRVNINSVRKMCICDLIPRCNTCCGINLRSASLLVGVFQLIFCSIHIPIIMLYYFEVTQKDVDLYSYYERGWFNGLPDATLVFGEAFLIFTSIALVLGVMKVRWFFNFFFFLYKNSCFSATSWVNWSLFILRFDICHHVSRLYHCKSVRKCSCLVHHCSCWCVK